MLSRLLLITFLVASGRGRSAKTAPFWIKARWARKRWEMKIVGREPIWRVIIRPSLAWSGRIMSESSNKDLRSRRKLPMNGKVKGPGGRLWDGFLVGKR